MEAINATSEIADMQNTEDIIQCSGSSPPIVNPFEDDRWRSSLIMCPRS